MSEQETRDAYVAVSLKLVNGKTISGRPIPYAVAMEMMGLADEWRDGGDPRTTLRPVLDRFHEVTGITKDDPAITDLSLGEIVDVVNRFFFLRRPDPADAAPSPTPAPTPGT